MSDLRSTIENASPRRSKLPWIIAVVVAALVASIAFAVTRGGAVADDADQAADEPVRGGTLEFALLDFQQSIDPQLGTNYAESIVAGNITDKLLWQDPDSGEITPWLAESWTFNDDLTEYTFTLRDDVTFSDGEPFNAAAVKANYDQYIRGDEALQIRPNGAQLFPGYIETVVVDEYTATIRFERPLSSALQAASFTANAGPGFLSPTTLKLNAEERTKPENIIGTGPFVYESWEPQVKVVLAKRTGYNWAPAATGHTGEAYLDKIVFNTIPEASVRTGSLTAGTIDATLDVGTTDEEPLRAQGFEIISRATSGTAIGFTFNASLAPTNELAVRKAINLGWNREAIEKTVLTDSYSIASSYLVHNVQGQVGYDDTALRYDPTEAKRLLDEAGWVEAADGIRERDGQKLKVRLWGLNNLVANKPSYESIQQDLKAIGIDVELQVVPIPDSASLRAEHKEKWNGNAGNRSRNDASVVNLQLNPTLGNTAYLDEGSPEWNRLLEVLPKIETTLDPTLRAQYAEEAQDVVVDELALVLPIYEPSQVIAHADYVHGIIFDAQSRNNFVDTWKSNGE